MSMTRLALAAVAGGLVVLGFGLGQYVTSSKLEQRRDMQLSYGAPPQPEVPAPAYAGPRPRAVFAKPQRPAGAAPLRPDGSPDTLLDALREPDAFARASRLSALLPTLGPEDVAEVRAALMDPAIDLVGDEIALLVRFWAAHDPTRAAAWAFGRAPRGFRTGAVFAAYEAWAKVDPQAARERLQTLWLIPGAANIDAAEIAIVNGWFDSGRPGLEDYIRDLGPGISRQRALSAFARKAIQRDGPEPIARWAESIPDEDDLFKLDAFGRLGMELGAADPAAAIAWCDAHCEGPFGAALRRLIAGSWASGDPRAAMDWVSTAPAGKERDRAVKAVFESWFRRDREGLSGWLNEMGPDGVPPWLEPALEAYAKSIAGKNPTEGIEWAGAITDPAVREKTFVTIAHNWRLRDASAAEAWIEQSPLSEQARERARAPWKPPKPKPAKRSCPCPDEGDSAEGEATSPAR